MHEMSDERAIKIFEICSDVGIMTNAQFWTTLMLCLDNYIFRKQIYHVHKFKVISIDRYCLIYFSSQNISIGIFLLRLSFLEVNSIIY